MKPQGWRVAAGWAVVAFVFLAGCARMAKSPTTLGVATGGLRSAAAESSFGQGYSQRAASGALRDSSPPGTLPSLDEELWVIARGEPGDAVEDDPGPGTGQMVTRGSDAEEVVPLPLRHTDVKAAVTAHIASVEVTQQFHNPYDARIEAVYVFPLPHNAAVNGFVLRVGERRIRGIIRERREAEQIYQEARSQGYVASLLTQERPNIFTQSVANIEPGRPIDVIITYFHTLAYDDGWYEWVFPMVVGPRFNPPGWTQGVAAVPRSQSDNAGQPTAVPYLKPRERSGHDVALTVRVDAGVAIEESICRTHAVQTSRPTPEQLVVTLSPNDRIPNRDLVLRWRVAGARLKSDLLTHRDAHGGFFTLMLYPPTDLQGLERGPLEMVFVLDCSGSMSGRPIEQAKLAVRRCLRQLQPRDTFQIIRFSDQATQLGAQPIAATPGNIEAGLRYLDRLRGEGGTMMLTGIKAALEFAHDPERLRFVCFLTDGYIGNETEILQAVEERLGASRILSFGVGSAVNRYLLDQLARLGRGAVAYLGPNDSVADLMDAFMARISHPALTDVTIDWGDWTVAEVFPRRVPDLFVGRSVILTGRFRETRLGPIRVRGRAGGREVHWALAPRSADAREGATALASVWARMKIADLGDHRALAPESELAGAIRQTALDYSLVSAFTAFVAVDASRRTEGDEGTTVPVAVPVPDGVKYHTTVPEGRTP